jgi:hypothetical protein
MRITSARFAPGPRAGALASGRLEVEFNSEILNLAEIEVHSDALSVIQKN